MPNYNLKPKLIIVLAITGLALFGFPKASQALDVNAVSCSQSDVQGAINQVHSAGGGTVYLPVCNISANPWTSSIQSAGGIDIIGQGTDRR